MKRPTLKLHPLFFAVGIWYAFKGELLIFLMSCLTALQHECAHAFAAARLGYSLRAIVLMPFGAVIDGDMRGVTAKDEIAVAVAGPLCNLITAAFFVAVWWFAPTMYAFTDTAFYTSLAIAAVNLLPAYPLDGGRILKAVLMERAQKAGKTQAQAEAKASKLCKAVTLCFALLCLAGFVGLCIRKTPNATLLIFSLFLAVSAFGNTDKDGVYARMDFSSIDALERGVEIRRVAVLESCTVKNTLKYLAKGTYLVLEVYDKNEKQVCVIPQNELAELFLRAETPHTTLKELKNGAFLHKKS